MRSYTKTTVIQCVELATARESAKVLAGMGRGVNSLAEISATAAFFGFLGTVLGIMNSFQSGTGGVTALVAEAIRLSNAMVFTVLALPIAIAAFWFHQYLRGRLGDFDVEMRGASVDLINRLIVHLERMENADPRLWLALTKPSSGAAFEFEVSDDERASYAPRFEWPSMHRLGVLDLVWPQLNSELDIAAAFQGAAFVCYSYGTVTGLVYGLEEKLATGFLFLAFFWVAGAAIARCSRLAVFVTLSVLSIVVCVDLAAFGPCASALFAATALAFLSGGVKAALSRSGVSGARGLNWLAIPLAVATVTAALFGTILNLFPTQPDDDSMLPTIQQGRSVFGINASIAGDIQRNQVWAIDYGGAIGSARVMALGGDHVKINGGALFVNGRRMSEPYCTPYSEGLGDFPPTPAERYSVYGKELDHVNEYVVPRGRYFVLNDNRKQLFDSRGMGPLWRNQFIARVIATHAAGSGFKLNRIH